MVIGEEFPLLYEEGLPLVGVRKVTQITGVSAPTINMWINRGVLPGVKIGAQGRARRFDASLIMHLAVVSALVRLGYSALFASIAHIEAFQKGDPREPGVHLVIETAPRNEFGRLEPVGIREIHVVKRSPEISLEEAIKAACSEGADGFAVIDLSAIWNRVKNEIESAASGGQL